ncbi:MAG: PEGA domain-containing protein [Methanolinea sp.]
MNSGLVLCGAPARILRLRLYLTLIIVCILFTIPFQVSAATTEIRVVKYAVDEFTILAEKTVDYKWMEQNLRVYGDGITHYYHQGPVFVDDPDAAKEEELRWNPAEDSNVQEKDMGAVKGTNMKDLCDLVGGMEPGDRLKIRSSDGWSKLLAYENVYEYSSREGPIIISWFRNGQYPDTGYTDGMRMIWFADTSTNPWGIHAFGNWDWHEAADEEYWYYYYNMDEKYPTTTGLSGQKISEILIYSQEEPTGGIEVTSTPAGADIILDGEETGEMTPFTFTDLAAGSYSINVQKEGYLASIEEWVDVSHGTVIPVHFDLEREHSDSHSGSVSDSYFSQDFDDAGEQGFLEVKERAIAGNISVLTAKGESQVCRSGQTLSYRIPTHTLSSNQLLWARLYILSYRGYTRDNELEVRVNSVKAGTPDRSTYYHGEGRVSETLAFNITSLVQESGTTEISARNPPGGNDWTLYPPVLVISRKEEGVQSCESWVAEGAGFIRAMKEYSPQDQQNITIADFSDIPMGSVHAELRVIGTSTENPDLSSPLVLENSIVIPGEYEYEQDGIWISRYNVSATVSGYTHNELFWKSADPVKSREVGPRVAILSVLYPKGSVAADERRDTSTDVENVSAQSIVENITPTSPAGPSLTSPTPGIPAVKPGIPMEEESFLSRIWRMILWIFGIQIPENGPNTADAGDSSEEITDTGVSGENDAFSLDHVGTSAGMYFLNVSTTPPGAVVSISGLSAVKTTPATFILPEGDYLINAGMDGYIRCQTMVHLTGSQEVSISLSPDDTFPQGDMEKIPARSRHGGLMIVTYPGDLEIWVDNTRMERKSPLILYGLKEGAHTVKATRPSATAGKGESVLTRTWIYHDALSICELDFVGIRLERRVRITDPTGTSTAFSLDGMYPLFRTPVTIELPRVESFVTLFGDGRFTSISIPDRTMDGSEFSLPAFAGGYHSVAIESSPAGAEIFVDGARTENTTPCLIRGLSEGPHRVMVSMQGYAPEQRIITVPRTDEEVIEGSVSFNLDTYPSGPLRVESIPEGVSIYLDGLATGEKTPCTFTGIPVGIHELTLKSEDRTMTRDITVRPDNPNRFFIDLL